MIYKLRQFAYSSPNPARRYTAVDIPTQQGNSEQGVTTKAAAAMKIVMAVLFLALVRESKLLSYCFRIYFLLLFLFLMRVNNDSNIRLPIPVVYDISVLSTSLLLRLPLQ